MSVSLHRNSHNIGLAVQFRQLIEPPVPVPGPLPHPIRQAITFGFGQWPVDADTMIDTWNSGSRAD